MSIVTEIRKTKQKWSLNPRGKAWAEDSNKFGQKMLEKMGWSHGKGLGAKENGMVEHIRVSYKNDTKGMGFKETDGQWTEHDSNFNAFLQQLSGENTEKEVKITSLEKKSQSSKVRVHYKKFTRGKDLSRCSEKDLANIFGKKSLKPEKEETKITEKEKELPDDGFSHNAGSMVDYFKKKLPNFAKNNSPVVLKKHSESEDETVGFGYNTPEKRKRKLSKESESESESYAGFGFKTPKKRKSNGEIGEDTPKKSEDEEHIGLSNPAFDPLFNNVEVQRHVLDTIKEEDEEIPGISKKEKRRNEETDEAGAFKTKKKKKRNGENGPNFSEDCENENLEQNNEDPAVEKTDKKRKKHEGNDEDTASQEDISNKKKKKKKNKKNQPAALDNPNFTEENCENSYFDENFEVKRKKKKSKTPVNGKSQNFDDDSCQDSFVNENFEVKRKKKKKEENAMALINPVFDSESVLNGYVDENFEVKRKKKNGQDTTMAIDNPIFDMSNGDEANYNNFFEVKRKKKKKKSKNEENMAIDNPTFNDSSNGQMIIDDELSNNTEPKTKKKRKKENEDTAIDNSIKNLSIIDAETESTKDTTEPNLDLILNITSTPTTILETSTKSSVKRRKSVRFSDVNEERIIPNKEATNELYETNSEINGNANLAFNKTQLILEEKVDEMSKKIDGFQAEIENDMNEAKVRYVGEVGNPDGENEKLPNGTKLKFKYAHFGKTPIWARKSPCSGAKSSYKHLIKGDIILGFNNTNLHEIKGYAVNNK